MLYSIAAASPVVPGVCLKAGGNIVERTIEIAGDDMALLQRAGMHRELMLEASPIRNTRNSHGLRVQASRQLAHTVDTVARTVYLYRPFCDFPPFNCNACYFVTVHPTGFAFDSGSFFKGRKPTSVAIVSACL